MRHGSFNKGQTMWRGSRMKSNCIPWTDGSGLTHQGHCQTMEGSVICFSALRSGCWRIQNVYNTHSSTEGLSLFVFFALVQIRHGSPKSSPPSISLSFQTRLTSISAGRRGDWDECIPIWTTPLSSRRGLPCTLWDCEERAGASPRGSFDCFRVAYLWTEYQTRHQWRVT